MTVFQDQGKFMQACGQTVGEDNPEQFSLYLNLIAEEIYELTEAAEREDRVEVFDALLDIIVVCIGAGLSAGFPMHAGWQEVMRSNMDKIDPETGLVRKRDDGKVLKPANWAAPDLASLIK